MEQVIVLTLILPKSERALYNISLTQYPIAKSNIKNTYTIFNTETDLSNSFGLETNEIGLSYSINFDYDEMIDITSGLSFKRSTDILLKKIFPL